MLSKFLVILWVLCSSHFIEAKPPELSSRDTRVKIEEILKAHVSHQTLTEELVARAILNYIDELDPSKTYFIASDVNIYLNPSQELLEETLSGYRKENFKTFEKIHEQMLVAIERRNRLEALIETPSLPKDVQTLDFKELSWAETEGELQERLCQIRALQLKTGQKIYPDAQDHFFQQLTKRRLNRENQFQSNSFQEKQQIIFSHILKATSAALDSQTFYFTPSEATQFMMQVQQKLFGIGAQLRDDLTGFSIVRIVEGGPASQSNQLKIGDRIIAVDGESVVGMDIVEAVELIRGPQGSLVSLTIVRPSKEQDEINEDTLQVALVRGEVVLKEARFDTMIEPYGDGVVGVVQLFSFYQDQNSSSASDLMEAISKMKKQYKVKGIILDLRQNAGGLLPQAVAVTGLFISKGIVVSIKDNTGQVQHLRNLDTNKVWNGPLIVLTARTSASAAEIVAQTLQDYGRALVVGDPETFGKGTFQTFTLESANFGKVNPKGEYKVTRGRYYTVSGKSPQLVGVKADIVVPGVFSQMEIGEKYSKFPVASDQISANFLDDLSDIPAIHRIQLNKSYKKELQPVLDLYLPYIEQLKANSKERIAQNKNFQNFLKELNKKEEGSDHFDFFGQNDLQLAETCNIIKDLIYLMDQSAKQNAA